jgi:hypothetical protein
LAIFQKEFHSSTTAAEEFRGTEVSIPALCRDRGVPLEPSPSVSIAVSIAVVSTVSIDLSDTSQTYL